MLLEFTLRIVFLLKRQSNPGKKITKCLLPFLARPIIYYYIFFSHFCTASQNLHITIGHETTSAIGWCLDILNLYRLIHWIGYIFWYNVSSWIRTHDCAKGWSKSCCDRWKASHTHTTYTQTSKSRFSEFAIQCFYTFPAACSNSTLFP